jgi:16S rRNA C967 or C1407 C5-methylase (RsmB/RsmF family)
MTTFERYFISDKSTWKEEKDNYYKYADNEEYCNKILKEFPNVEVVPISFQGMNNLPTLPTTIKGTLLVRPNEFFEGFYVCKLKKK